MAAEPHPIPELDRAGLRNFGLTTGAIIVVLFGLGFPWLLGRGIPLWPWVIGGALGAWGLAAPKSLRPVYRLWMRFGLLMSRVTTPLILGIAFYLVLTPISFFRKLMGGHDSLARRFDPESGSYRVISRKPSSKNLERPY